MVRFATFGALFAGAFFALSRVQTILESTDARREENQQKKEMARLVQIKRKEAIREIREKGLEPM